MSKEKTRKLTILSLIKMDDLLPNHYLDNPVFSPVMPIDGEASQDSICKKI